MHRLLNYKNAFRILKGGKISLVVSAFLTTATLVHAAPSGGTVTTGSATISQSGNTTNINQSSNKSSINWQSFNIGSNEVVNFNQPNSSSITLNRVVGASNSLISGAMNANGQVILVNPNGVVFAQGSNVNVGGLIATTKNITDQDFQNGNYKFEGNSTASILNKGTINAKYVAMMGKEVVNEGSIIATMGRIELAGGDKFTLNLNGDSLVKLTIDEGTLNALVENKGLIKADGGKVYLTTQAVDSILNGVVNNSGIVEAQSLQNQNGEIVLFAHGGTANIAGEIKAEAGFVETSGHKVNFADDMKIKAKNLLIDPYDVEIVADAAVYLNTTSYTSNNETETYTANTDSTKIKASHIVGLLNDSNNVFITTNGGGTQNGDITVSSAINWSQDTKLTLRADRNININADITATNANGKLALEYGQTTANSDYNIAQNVKINLKDGQNFSTKNGGDPVINYTVINSATALQGMSLTGNTAIGSDVDLSSITNWTPLGDPTNGSANSSFKGHFLGLGHNISNLTTSGSMYSGLFASTSYSSVTSGALIRDLILSNISVSGTGYVGGLVGFDNGGSNANNGTRIKNIHIASGTVTGGFNSTAGGLAGRINEYSSVLYSDSYATISNSYSTGGLVGQLKGGSIKYSFAAGNVTNTDATTGSYASGVGGLVGYMDRGSDYSNPASINYSYALGKVTGNDAVGGLIGRSGRNTNSISNSYATGEIVSTGSNVGGVIGVANAAPTTYTNVYFDSTTTGKSNAYGAVTTGAITNTNAYSQSSYTNFDFTNDWFMVDGFTRPFLRSEWTPVVSNAHELQMMSSKLGSSNVISYKLANDINLAPSLTNKSEMWKDNSATVNYSDYKGSWTPIGFWTWNDAVTFYGSLYGQNHTIDNLTVTTPASPVNFQAGLFGYISPRNYNISPSLVSAPSISNLILSNVYIDNTDSGSSARAGALIGTSYGTAISNVVVISGTVKGKSTSGGLIGEAGKFNASDVGSITNSYSLANVYIENPVFDAYAGGIAGGLADWTVDRSFSNATITYTGGNSGSKVGGFVGSSFGTVYNDSYALGNINGNFTNPNAIVGGFVAATYSSIDDTTLNNVYSAMTYNINNNAQNTGGLIGKNFNITEINNSFWDSTLKSGLNTIAVDSGTATLTNAVGKTTSEMNQLVTFSATTPAWDIVTDSSLSNVYPQLRWATNGLSSGNSIWVIGSYTPPSGGGNHNLVTTPANPTPNNPSPVVNNKTEQKVNEIVTNIVNNAVKNNVSVNTVVNTPVKTDVINVFDKKVSSSIVNNTPSLDNTKSLGNSNLGLNEVIRSVKPDVNTVSKDTKLTVVGETGGEGQIAVVELADLVAKSGGGELRVALSPDSFVELVNGGVTLPDGVSQEFYVVEDKK